MTGTTDCYARGYQQAQTDQDRGWWHQWLAARELAEDAVYAPLGLSEEQRGYAAALWEQSPELDASLPQGIANSMRLLDQGPRPGQTPLVHPPVTRRVGSTLARRLPGRLAKRLYFSRCIKRQRGKREAQPAFERGMA